jgi:hypothetical protein
LQSESPGKKRKEESKPLFLFFHARFILLLVGECVGSRQQKPKAKFRNNR